MGVTNLGRVQGGGFYYADYTPSEAETSIRLGRVWLKPNTVKALIGDHVVMADGSLWEITAFSSDGETDLVMTLDKKTSIQGKKGDTGAQGEAGIGCSINGVPTALDFTSNPQSQLNDLKQQNTSQSSQIDVLKKLYAVGSIYMSVNSTSPASLFGGTWEQITEKFLLASSQLPTADNPNPTRTYIEKNSGGSASVTLTKNNLPNTLEVGQNKSGVEKWISGCLWNNQAYANEAWVVTQKSYLNDVGNNYIYNQPHDNMPPYYVVNIWRRTA